MNSENKYDVIIVGAGPAGLEFARNLKLNNFSGSMLILDKKKNPEDTSYNTLGSYIDFKKFNLPDNIAHQIDTVHWASDHEHHSFSSNPKIIDRRKLLSFLDKDVDKYKNVTKIYNASVEKAAVYKDRITNLEYTDSNKKDIIVEGRLYVDASGPARVLAKNLNFEIKQKIALGIEYLVPVKKESNVADIYLGRNFSGGYGWIFPINKQHALIGYGTMDIIHPDKLESSIANMWQIERIKERVEYKIIERKVAPFVTGHPLDKLVKNNLLILGDCALQANPVYGEGTRFVMDSARIASAVIIDAFAKNNLDLLGDYEYQWKRKYYKQFKICYHFQQLFVGLSKNPQICDKIIKRFADLNTSQINQIQRGEISYLDLFKLWLFKIFN